MIALFRRRAKPSSIAWDEIIQTTCASRAARNPFPYPVGFKVDIMLAVMGAESVEARIEVVARMVKAMDANLQGLFIDGAGI